jgi:bacterioferritin
MTQGPLRPELSKFLEGEIEDELGHAKFLAHKIVALGGTPVTEPAPVTLTESNREMLQLALQAEKDTIERYTQRIKQADAVGDVGLRVELETIVADETRHMEDLERVLFGWRD